MRPRRSEEPVYDALIRWIGRDGRRKLFACDFRKIHEPFIHGTGIDVLAFRAGKGGAALIDHASQVDPASERRTHTARELSSQIHRGRLQQLMACERQVFDDYAAVFERNNAPAGRQIGVA